MSLFPKWNVKSAGRWEKTRARGKTRFVIKGALCWGIVMAGLMTVVHTFSTPGASVTKDFAINLPVFIAGGVLFYVLMWNMLEAAYRNYLSQQELKTLDTLSAKS